jgi:hypothetical protein
MQRIAIDDPRDGEFFFVIAIVICSAIKQQPTSVSQDQSEQDQHRCDEGDQASGFSTTQKLLQRQSARLGFTCGLL